MLQSMGWQKEPGHYHIGVTELELKVQYNCESNSNKKLFLSIHFVQDSDVTAFLVPVLYPEVVSFTDLFLSLFLFLIIQTFYASASSDVSQTSPQCIKKKSSIFLN